MREFPQISDCEGKTAGEEGECCGDEVARDRKEDGMDTDADRPKFSKKYLDKLSKTWKDRRERRKKKKLSSAKKHKW